MVVKSNWPLEYQ